MKLSGKIIVRGKTVKSAAVVKEDAGRSFHDLLEQCLVDLCKELDIPVPLWLRNNTSEFSQFRRTAFHQEHFLEETDFDRFEMRLEKS